MLSRKLPSRPVISTATGGSTTQKKYRNAFIGVSKRFNNSTIDPFTPSISQWSTLRSLDSTVDRGKDHPNAFQDRHLFHRDRSRDISRSAHCAPPAFQGVAWHRAPHCPADRAPFFSASQSLSLSSATTVTQLAFGTRRNQSSPLSRLARVFFRNTGLQYPPTGALVSDARSAKARYRRRLRRPVRCLEFHLAGHQSRTARFAADFIRRNPVCHRRRGARGRLDRARAFAARSPL